MCVDIFWSSHSVQMNSTRCCWIIFAICNIVCVVLEPQFCAQFIPSQNELDSMIKNLYTHGRTICSMFTIWCVMWTVVDVVVNVCVRAGFYLVCTMVCSTMKYSTSVNQHTLTHINMYSFKKNILLNVYESSIYGLKSRTLTHFVVKCAHIVRSCTNEITIYIYINSEYCKV